MRIAWTPMLSPTAVAASWMTGTLAALGRWGYFGVALGVFLESAGVPVPGETVLLAAAFGAAHGVLSLPGIIAVATVASILGDNVGFAVGRRLGRGWVEQHGARFFLTSARVARVDEFFERYGPLAVALARFVTGVRVVAAFLAGTSRMPWSVFLRYNMLGAIAWATLVSIAGYLVGRGYVGVAQRVGSGGVVLAVVVPLALLSAWLLAHYRSRGSDGSAMGSATTALEGFASLRGGGLRARWSPLTLRWVVVLSLSAAAVVTFAAMAEEVVERETMGIDAAVRSVAQGLQSASLHAFFTALTWAGSLATVGPVAAAVSIWLWRRGASGRSARAALLSMSSVIVMLTFKEIFHRTRPLGAVALPQLGYSFPSGHALNTMAIGVTLAYLLYREAVAPRWAVGAAVVFSLLVGVSRVYLDVHWATDVIGGWSLGVAIAAGCALFNDWPCLDRDVSRGAREESTLEVAPNAKSGDLAG